MSGLEDVFAALNRARVRYLLIGGLASILHGVPRTTTDIDIALDPRPENVRRALRALGRITLVADTDDVKDILGQGGVTASNDLSVDLLTALPVGRFADVWRRRVTLRYHGVRAPSVSKRDQIRLLRAAGRPRDLEDADYLDSIRAL